MQERSEKFPKKLEQTEMQKSLKMLKDASICIVGEKHAAPIVFVEKDFYVVNTNGNADSEKYAKSITSFANIYIKAKFPNLDLTADTVSPIPKIHEDGNVAFYCVVVTGKDCEDKKNELTEVADLIRKKITLQSEVADKESTLDISCLDDAIANFLNKNSLKQINGKFSVGNCYDISKHIPIRLYGPRANNTETDSVLSGYAIQNGYKEKDNVIYLLAYNEGSYVSYKPIAVKIPNASFINTVIKSRLEGMLLSYEVAKERNSSFYHLKSLSLSDVKISTNMNLSQKDKSTYDLFFD